MINRPTVPTIYPPGAQLWFAARRPAHPGRLDPGARYGWERVSAVVGTTAILGRELASPGRR